MHGVAAIAMGHTAVMEGQGSRAESETQQDCCRQSYKIFNFFHPISSFFSPAARPSFII
jgi:hypothetical protein